MELGLHVSDFTWSGGPRDLRAALARTVRDAEAAGVARITVMDHLWQIPGVGRPEAEMLEGYTALGFIAAHTERVLLHTLVSAVTYRAPGMLAKQVATLDALSGGRAGLGIGAGWYEEEATGLGLPFPSLGERFERLEEALRICLAMWGADEEPFRGAHYTLERTLSSPHPLSHPRPYLLIGGGGERKTLRYVAQYADACNLFGGDTAHKLDVLRRHCDAVGRDYDTIDKTTTMSVDPDTTRDQLLAGMRELRERGFTVAYLSRPGEPGPLVDLIGSVAPEVAQD